MKRKSFQKQLENLNLCYFSSCDSLHKGGSVIVPFPSVLAAETIGLFAENFKIRLNYFSCYATSTSIFENSFSIEGSGDPENCISIE
jgi:hypothetical protein